MLVGTSLALADFPSSLFWLVRQFDMPFQTRANNIDPIKKLTRLHLKTHWNLNQPSVFTTSFIIVCLIVPFSSYIKVGIKIWILLNALLIEEQTQLKIMN